MPTARLKVPVKKAMAANPKHLVRRLERRRERREGKRVCAGFDENKWPEPVHVRD